MAINADRLWGRIEALARLTDPARPWTRRSFSPLFMQGRTWLLAEFRAAGLIAEIDAGGNLVGHLPGTVPGLKPIIIGSHSDTVPSGGRFDGVLGILAGLECAQSLIEAGRAPRHPIEIVDFLAEEPSEFGISCIGSRAITGALTDSMLQLGRSDGLSLAEGLRLVGGNPAALEKLVRAPGSVAAYVELHIEQGRVLEEAGLDIGIVTDIVSIRRERIVIRGRADHAGATPMHLRSDALVGAAILIKATHDRACAICQSGTPLVATVGYLEVRPNAANAVPGEVDLALEVRSGDAAASGRFGGELRGALAADLAQLGLDVQATMISDVAPTPCDQLIKDAIASASDALGYRSCKLPSGAGHDGVFMARIAPIGMIFTPCRGGRSHAPEEWLEPKQAAAGANVLAETMRRLDATLNG